jgi:hypothetical protein
MKKVISIVCASAYFCQSAHALNSDDHRGVTQEAAVGLFSPQAAQLLAQAATEPDVYDWETAAAHAQTPNDSNGKPALSPSQAVEQCVSYLADKAKQFRAQLGAGNVGNAIYILGYTLHTIQDFSAHQGITNAEHSYLSFVRNLNPDEDARRVSQRLLTRSFIVDWLPIGLFRCSQRSASIAASVEHRIAKQAGFPSNLWAQAIELLCSDYVLKTWR